MPVGKAIDLTLLPLMGCFGTYCAAELFIKRCDVLCDVDPPEWESKYLRDHYLRFFIWSNMLAGLGSYQIWKVGQTDPEAIETPLAVYTFTMFLNWAHYPLVRADLKCALIDSALMMTTAIYTFGSFYRVSFGAALLITPFVTMTIHQTLKDIWCYKRHKDTF